MWESASPMLNNTPRTSLHVMMFAGPNGSGKTSLIDDITQSGLAPVRHVYPFPASVINPDQVAKDLSAHFATQDARDEAAQSAAVKARADAIAGKLPFAFETVMSHPSRMNEMLVLKEQGYQLLLTFICTDDAAKNVARVTQRYETGTTTGHYVAPDKVRERYGRTLALLPRAAEIADTVVIYDNSVDFEKPALQAVIERDGQFAVAPGAREWVIQCLVQPLQQRERERDQLFASLQEHGHQMDFADELHGHYNGPVLFHTPYFVAQLDTATSLAVVHDRIMLDTARKGVGDAMPAYTHNEQLTISYSPASAPQVR